MLQVGEGDLGFQRGTMSRLIVCMLSFCLSLSSFTLADESKSKDYSELLARFSLVQAEVEHLRYVLGKQKVEPYPDEINSVGTRDLFFQVQSLFKLSDSFAYEFTRKKGRGVDLPTGKISYSQVTSIMEDALSRLRAVKSKLGLEALNPYPSSEEISPDLLYQQILDANRQLNALLDEPIKPNDVYYQLSVIINYSASILAQFPQVERIPEQAKLVWGKRPRDVIQELLECHRLLKELGSRLGQPLINYTCLVKVQERDDFIIEPIDVYSIATLLLAEISELHSKLGINRVPRATYYPRAKFSSHAFQKSQIVKEQIQTMQKMDFRSLDGI